jgi:hypothetical protein
MAHINEHGNATSNVTMLGDSLASLWQYLAAKGDYEDTLCIPVLGTGASRVQRTRDEIIRLIIDSFIAGCAAQKFCDCLRICIGPRDFQTHDIDLAALEQYLTVRCRYASFLSKLDTGAGVPV